MYSFKLFSIKRSSAALATIKASSLPLINISNKLLKNKIIDLCSAPGGKSFQVLSKGKKVILNDISKSRIDLLKTNLNRLKFKTKSKVFDPNDVYGDEPNPTKL